MIHSNQEQNNSLVNLSSSNSPLPRKTFTSIAEQHSASENINISPFVSLQRSDSIESVKMEENPSAKQITSILGSKINRGFGFIDGLVGNGMIHETLAYGGPLIPSTINFDEIFLNDHIEINHSRSSSKMNHSRTGTSSTTSKQSSIKSTPEKLKKQRTFTFSAEEPKESTDKHEDHKDDWT